MENKSKTIVLDQDIVQILFNENLSYKPFLIRFSDYSYHKHEIRWNKEELKELADFINGYLQNIEEQI